MMIRPIVEGRGEEAAVPELLRRLRNEAQVWSLEIGRPVRRERTLLVRKDELQKAVQVAFSDEKCRGVLVIFDADDDCPAQLAPSLERWTREAAGNKASALVMANREYEAWFLASIESLRGRRGILLEATSHADPEKPRDAKGELRSRMEPQRTYSPSADQAALTGSLDLEAAYRRCRSFRKLVSAFGNLATAVGAAPAEWPPAKWAV